MDWMTEIWSPAEAKEFSSSLCVQTGSGAHPASCPMGTGFPSPGQSATREWRWPLTPIYCQSQEWLGAIPPLPQVPPWRVVGLLYFTLLYFTLHRLKYIIIQEHVKPTVQPVQNLEITGHTSVFPLKMLFKILLTRAWEETCTVCAYVHTGNYGLTPHVLLMNTEGSYMTLKVVIW
jgi:hypothetical protein